MLLEIVFYGIMIFNIAFLSIPYLNSHKLTILNFYPLNPSWAFHKNDKIDNLKTL